MRRWWWAVPAVLVVALGAVVALGHPQVTERDPLYQQDFVRQVELFGSWRVTFGSETFRFYDGDTVLGVPVLLAAGFAVAVGLVLRRAGAASRRTAQAYVWGGVGLAVLALDELFGLHETLGHNLEFLTALGVKEADDAIFALYPLAIAAYVVAFRRVLLRSRVQTVLFSVAGGLIVVAAFSDVVVHPPERLEDLVELVAAFLGLVGLADLVRRDLGELGRTLDRAAVLSER